MFPEVMIVYWLYGLTGMVYLCSTLCRFEFHTLQLLIENFLLWEVFQCAILHSTVLLFQWEQHIL